MLGFGTSGLRGPASEFTERQVGSFVQAFLEHVAESNVGRVFVGCDRRPSSPLISSRVLNVVAQLGFDPVWAGISPTPAVAAEALRNRVPAIVVTGSHIQENYNGLKFFRPDGELLKDDEGPIRKRAADLLELPEPGQFDDITSEINDDMARNYVARYTSAFGPHVLEGRKIGVFKHSAAGRDLLKEIFFQLGAEVICFGSCEDFVAVDTEALDPGVLALCVETIKSHSLDAVVSTDGDGDRPLLIGEDGLQLNGDALCALAARNLGITTVVTPLTSTSAIELSGWFHKIVRTRIGSPYVVQAMKDETSGVVAGFEANGGFLLGSDLELGFGNLTKLPTRDAVLPLIAVLAECKSRNVSVSKLATQLPTRLMQADRLKQIAPSLSDAFLLEIAGSADLRAAIDQDLRVPAYIDLTDGIRFHTQWGDVIHFRASGNAPELRVYVETTSAQSTRQKLNSILARTAEILAVWPSREGKIRNG